MRPGCAPARRRASSRRSTSQCWELRYDFTRLRSQVARLDPETAEPVPSRAAPPAGAVAFVPLASMKKNELMAQQNTTLSSIGSGTGGYVAAIRARAAPV